MKMHRMNANGSDTLSTSIRRQIGTDANARYLKALPVFRVDRDLPSELRDKLKKLEQSTKRRKS
ncbi:MAG: hypothetical protein ABWZ57_14665 [Mesorhizobium sp.]|jgi:hypothetical protein